MLFFYHFFSYLCTIMIYLIIAIICGSMFAVIFRIFQSHNVDSEQAIMLNYLTGAIVSIIPILTSDAPMPDGWLADSVLSYRTLLALVEGALFVCGFTIMDWSTWRNGIALTTAAARASLILPVVFSWLFLSQPSPAWLPVAMIIVALILIVVPNKPQEREIKRSKSDASRARKAALTLSAVFVFYGTSDFLMKIIQNAVEIEYSGNSSLTELHLNLLTVTLFIMATLLSFIICLAKGRFRKNGLTLRTTIGGIILGLANTGCTTCMLRGLGSLPTGIYYPIYNIGIVSLAAIIGLTFFHEKLTSVQYLGLVIAVIAIALSF